MFRKKRIQSLARKVQKFMKKEADRASSSKQTDCHWKTNTRPNQEELAGGLNKKLLASWSEFQSAFISYINQCLDEHQLKTLLRSLESKGGIQTDCIPIKTAANDSDCLAAKILESVGLRIDQAHVLLCKLLRWPELLIDPVGNTTAETTDTSTIQEQAKEGVLKSLTICEVNYYEERSDEGLLKSVCGNPFHYSCRITKPDKRKCYERSETFVQHETDGESRQPVRAETTTWQTIPGNESSSEDEKEVTLSQANSNSTFTPQSYTIPERPRNTATTTTTSSSFSSWCSIAYWETKRRIGRIFDVRNECVDVFYELPQGNGLCIGLLDQVERTEYVNNVRRHIGYGFQLTLEHSGIWIYNRSEYCIFISSPTLTSSSSTGKEATRPDVIRIPSGHCLHVVDFRRPLIVNRNEGEEKAFYDVYCIRVSFAKGWGENYTRQFITSCPCWAEIHLKETCLTMMGLR